MSEQANTPEIGKIWQTADTLAEALKWQGQYLLTGAAAVELKPRGRVVNGLIDDPLVDVIVTMEVTDVDTVNPVLGYRINEDEWMTECEMLPLQTPVFVAYDDDVIRFGKIIGRRTTEQVTGVLAKSRATQLVTEYWILFACEGTEAQWISEDKVSKDVNDIARPMIAANTPM